MKNKLLSGALAVMVTALFFGMLLAPTISQAQNNIVPVGKTAELSSQLVFWYDADTIDNFRFSFLQVTNVGNEPVNVHVQVFASTCTNWNGDFCNPGGVVLCAETDFNDFYTPNDTHIYFMDGLFTNESFQATDASDEDVLIIGDFEGTKGFVVVTPVDGPGTRNAIAHQHMFGTSYVINQSPPQAWIVSAMGRDAVSFSTGSVAADGTLLDGVSSGYVLLQPDILKFNFSSEEAPFCCADIVSIAFRDNYEGVFGYVAEPADATWTPLIFDEDENPISCSAVPQNCFFDIGVNSEMPPVNDLLNTVDQAVLCPANDFATGWMKIAVGGIDGLENELGLATFTVFASDTFRGVAHWMYSE